MIHITSILLESDMWKSVVTEQPSTYSICLPTGKLMHTQKIEIQRLKSDHQPTLSVYTHVN